MAENHTIRLKTSKAIGAMLGAAYGDALGWPNERAAKSITSKQTQGRLTELKSWTRRSGGRFLPYEEVIEAGEYSDDTQLILCVSRSLQKGDKWWDHFTQVELPFWSIYERGGGGATKRAVDSWLDCVAPWSSNRSPQDVKRYFDAGGNGVAMRILPHVLLKGENAFPEVADNIFRDGIATHGHPRALLGALAYGFALWIAIRKESQLTYGELVEELINGVEIWSAFPTSPSLPHEWSNQAGTALSGYSTLWESTKAEIIEYLDICRKELSKGALSFDEDVLKSLQCFNSKISGAGTVAAVAAVYLASRHAADPFNGVVKAAFATGSDTDTIASMTGGLLGCINGSAWITQAKQGIQDAAYIEKNGSRLASRDMNDDLTIESVKRSGLKNWIEDVVTARDSSEVALPDRRVARVTLGNDYIGRSGKFKVEFRRLACEDGQSIFLNKISKGDFGTPNNSSAKTSNAHQQMTSKTPACGSKIPVASFEKAINFYRDCLGLAIKKQSSEVVVFDQGLVLVPLSYVSAFAMGIQLRTMIYIQATNIDERFRKIKDSDLQIISALAPWGKSRVPFFRCFDPDGNLVEVFSIDSQ